MIDNVSKMSSAEVETHQGRLKDADGRPLNVDILALRDGQAPNTIWRQTPAGRAGRGPVLNLVVPA